MIRLQHKDYFELTKLVDAHMAKDGQKRFEAWEDAERYFSKQMGKQVTEFHIKTALKTLGKTKESIISSSFTHNWLTALNSRLDSLLTSIEELKQRVTDIEEKLK